MSRLSKKAVLFALLLVASLVQISCSPQSASKPPATIKPAGVAVNLPITIPYLIANPLKVVNSQDSAQLDSVCYISGLADKAIEDSINARLKDLYQELKERELPPL